MAFRIQIRRDTTINWAAVNPILLDGEMGLDTTLNCTNKVLIHLN